jgi:hypothetical protein
MVADKHIGRQQDKDKMSYRDAEFQTNKNVTDNWIGDSLMTMWVGGGGFYAGWSLLMEKVRKIRKNVTF